MEMIMEMFLWINYGKIRLFLVIFLGWMRSSRVWMRSSRMWMRSSRVWMRSSRMWMRSSRVWMRSSPVWWERLTANVEVATASWVRSQQPTTQWSPRGGRWSSTERNKIIISPFKNINFLDIGISILYSTSICESLKNIFLYKISCKWARQRGITKHLFLAG